MRWDVIALVLSTAVLPLMVLAAVFVRRRRLDGSGLYGGIPNYPSTASGGFAATPRPPWADEPAWLAEQDSEAGDDDAR